MDGRGYDDSCFRLGCAVFFWNNQTIIVEGGFTTVGLTKKPWFLCSRQPSGNLEGSRKWGQSWFPALLVLCLDRGLTLSSTVETWMKVCFYAKMEPCQSHVCLKKILKQIDLVNGFHQISRLKFSPGIGVTNMTNAPGAIQELQTTPCWQKWGSLLKLAKKMSATDLIYTNTQLVFFQPEQYESNWIIFRFVFQTSSKRPPRICTLTEK